MILPVVHLPIPTNIAYRFSLFLQVYAAILSLISAFPKACPSGINYFIVNVVHVRSSFLSHDLRLIGAPTTQKHCKRRFSPRLTLNDPSKRHLASLVGVVLSSWIQTARKKLSSVKGSLNGQPAFSNAYSIRHRQAVRKNPYCRPRGSQSSDLSVLWLGPRAELVQPGCTKVRKHKQQSC